MVLKFSLDPQTGVVVPPVTVFNGGKRKASTKRSGASAKKNKKTRKSKKGKKSKKTLRRKH
jgi:hypothetical protein